jgi:hypothetical protein
MQMTTDEVERFNCSDGGGRGQYQGSMYIFSSTGRVKPKRTANNLLGFEPGTSEHKSLAAALACLCPIMTTAQNNSDTEN